MKQFVFILILASVQVGCSKFKTTNTATSVPPATTILPSEEKSTMSVNGPFLADGSSPADVRIVVLDKDGNPISNANVVLSVSGDRNVIVPCSTTDSAGRSACTVYSTFAQSKDFRADATSEEATITLTQVVNFLLPAHQRIEVSTVSAGDLQTASGGQVILSSSGSTESPLASQDSNGVTRLLSSVLAAMM